MAARDVVRSQAFAQRYSIESAYGSYQELADDHKVGKSKPQFLFPLSLFHLQWGTTELGMGGLQGLGTG